MAGMQSEVGGVAPGRQGSPEDGREVTDILCSTKQVIFYLEILNLRASRPLLGLVNGVQKDHKQLKTQYKILCCRYAFQLENVPSLLSDCQRFSILKMKNH